MNTWNPDAYLAAFLTFHQALPKVLSSDLPAPLASAVAFSIANPVPQATIEYMAAFGDTLKLGHIAYGLSLTAIDHITPEVSAFFNAWMHMPAPAAPGTVEQIILTEPEPIQLIGHHAEKMEYLA